MDNDIREHLSKDSVMRGLVENFQPPAFRKSVSLYQDLLRSIVGQQLSGKAAATIYNRFLDLFEERIPHAANLLELDMDTLRSAGLSRQKASYLQNVAAFFQEEGTTIQTIHKMDDEAVIEYLTRIKGVGRWTVEMILMFTMNRPDVFPLDDLGIRNAIIRNYAVSESGRALKKRMLQVAETWRPYRTYACWYLWRSLEA